MRIKPAGLLFLLTFYVLPACAQVPFSLIISEQLRSRFTLVGSGARAAGMGGAFTAVADDATASSFNPAGLAQLIVPEASVVFDRTRLSDKYRDFILFDPEQGPLPVTDSDARFNRSELNFLSVTLPFRWVSRRWSAQFSTQKAVDLTYHGNRTFTVSDQFSNPSIDIHQKSDQSGGIRIYSGSLAISATRRMLLGITINRWKGDWKVVSANSETPLDSPEPTDLLNYKQDNALSGWNYDLGMLLRYKYANVGIRYRSHFSANYRLEAQVDTNILEAKQPLSDIKTKLQWPSTLDVGIAMKPFDRLTVAVDYGRTDWSKMLFELPDPAGKVNFFDLQSAEKTLVRTANDWRIGAEYLLFFRSAVLPVRAGWSHEPQPGIDAGTDKRIVSTGRTFGAGIKINWFAIDFAYQRVTSRTPITLFEPDDLVIGDRSGPSQGSLRRSEHRLLLSMILQVPKSTFLDRWIRIIFVEPETASH